MSELSIPQSIGQYKLLREIGKGADSVVYHAIIEAISRSVAIKVVKSERYLHEDPLMRITYEAKSVNLAKHPGIVDIFEVGSLNNNEHYIVMEYILGENLARRSEKYGVPNFESALWFTRETSSILTYVHSKGVVHRDIKPTNLMFAEDIMMPSGTRIKIVDFGLAKIPQEYQGQGGTTTGYFMGTQRYASPEQILDASKVDHKTDVYSLGVVVYEMLTEICPTIDFLNQRTPQAPNKINKSIPEAFSDLIVSMLNFKADKRPAMDEVFNRCKSLYLPQKESIMYEKARSLISNDASQNDWLNILEKITPKEREYMKLIYHNAAQSVPAFYDVRLLAIERPENHILFELIKDPQNKLREYVTLPFESISTTWHGLIEGKRIWCVLTKGYLLNISQNGPPAYTTFVR